MGYKLDPDKFLTAFQGWSEVDKARAAGLLFGDCNPTDENCRSFFDAAGETNSGELSARIDEYINSGSDSDGG